MKIPFAHSLQHTKFFILIVGLVVVCGSIATWLVYQHAYTSGLQYLKERTFSIATALDASAVANLAGAPSDVDQATYQLLKQKLVTIKDANPDVRFIYIMKERNDKLYFVMDSESPDSEDYSYPGETYYDESPALSAAVQQGVIGTEGPLADSFGTWVTGTAPLYGADGSIVAALGIDVDAHEYRTAAIQRAALFSLVFIFAIIFLIFEYALQRKDRQSIDLRSHIVATASHEIRSPLVGITWALDELHSRTAIPEDSRTLIADIQNRTKGLIDTVNDILETFALDSRKANVEFTKAGLAELLSEARALIAFAAQEHHVTIHADAIPDDAFVLADKKRLMQAFTNIISNAIKYSPQGGEVSLTYRHSELEHTITVIDKGIGIPDDEVQKVFNGFYRASNARESKINGSGLGLFLVKSVVEQHKGHIVLESGHNRGTKVTITLPAA